MSLHSKDGSETLAVQFSRVKIWWDVQQSQHGRGQTGWNSPAFTGGGLKNPKQITSLV